MILSLGTEGLEIAMKVSLDRALWCAALTLHCGLGFMSIDTPTQCIMCSAMQGSGDLNSVLINSMNSVTSQNNVIFSVERF